MKETLLGLTLTEQSAGLRRRDFSSLALTEAYLARIEAQDGTLGAYLTMTADSAKRTAEAIDRRRSAGEALPPLAGIPIAYKDNLCTKGVRTTCASRMLEHFIPPYSATVVERLQSCGAVMLGKCNMDEFAMGSTNESSAFHPVRNPRDLTRVPGGSSGGSAAAVASAEASAALGSDTGGSVRNPAACCGIVGIKPTYGAVSRYGLVAFASSLDQVGTLARTVRDGALMLDAQMGHDARDATSAARSHASCTDAIGQGEIDLRGIRIGLPYALIEGKTESLVASSVFGAADALRGCGAVIEPITLSDTEGAIAAYQIISSAEASSNLARYDGVRYGHRSHGAETVQSLFSDSRSEGLGEEVKRRILFGTYVLSAGHYDAYYRRATALRTAICREWQNLLSHFDAILLPTMASLPPLLGERRSPSACYADDCFIVQANLTGLPALSLCCAVTGGGLPIGCQLVGQRFGEASLCRIAAALEDALQLPRRSGGALPL